MAKYNRPTSTYTPVSTTTNINKYLQDSTANPPVPISSTKVDADINYAIDAVNELNDLNAGGAYTDLEAAVTQIKTNEDAIAALVTDLVPDGDYGDITVSGGATIWTIDPSAVTEGKIADNAVTEGKINSSSVTLAKLADISSYTVIGNTTGSAATPSEITVYDEDDMVSDSATGLATQQSIKAYVDGKTLDASTTEKGVVEIATAAEVTSETATGGTGASLSVTPATMKSHQGVAKAWVNFDGTGTVSIRDSYNVSSITDLGTGYYRINLAITMANTSYTVASSICGFTSSSPGIVNMFSGPGFADAAPTTTSFTVTTSGTGSLADSKYVLMSVYGDLA